MEGTQVGATPVSHGAALPHIRAKGIEHSELIMLRVKNGVQVDISKEFIGEQDFGKPIYAFFFLASPEDNPGQHLRILAQIASHVDDENFLGKWLDAKNIQELKELLLREDRYISLTLRNDSRTGELIDQQLKNLRLPIGCLIILIKRHNEFIVPTGKTTLKENDRLTITGEPNGIQILYSMYYDAH
jgi:mannitol/fructose-specific phosphotransferase system IIA component (Ntr-type)